MEARVARLLVDDRDIPAPIREALSQGQTEEAARLLMDEYELSCADASILVDAPACDE